MSAVPHYAVRRTWKNHLGNQRIDPLRIYRPSSIAQVTEIVQAAAAEAVTVRAVGSGHSWSDVALTDGFLIDTRRLARVPAGEPDFVRDAWRERKLLRVEAGIRIKELNAHLDRHGLALPNMGGYDHQTVAGVISTSTHGSGIKFGPLNDLVRSLDIVAGDGSVIRVEPSDGPTDATRFHAHHGDRRRLVQDDRWFNAVAVGIGCMGVIVTALVELRDKFYLRETRTRRLWADVKADLASGVVLEDNEHYELLFSPYKRRREYPFLVTTRNTTDDPRNKLLSKRTRNWAVELASRLPFVPPLINFAVHLCPRISPLLLEWSITALVKDEYDSVSYKVFNIGAANVLPAYSAEIAVPIDGRHIEAIERIIAVADHHRALGEVFQSAPIALRFVRSSDAYMSMMHGRDTMMIELIQLKGCRGGYELIAAYERALAPLAARPHWGQINSLAGGDELARLYPHLSEWLDVRREIDPAGSFAAPFTHRVGIS